MYNTLLFYLAELSIGISMLILLLVIFQKLFGKRFAARCRYILWAFVVLRLCIPFSIPFLPALLEISLPDEIVQTDPPLQESVPSADSYPVSPIPSYTIESNVPETDSPPLSANQPSVEEAEPIPGLPVPDIPAPDLPVRTETEKPTFLSDPVPCLFFLWIGIALLLFIFRLAEYWVVTIRLKKSLFLPDAEQAALCRRLGIRLGIRKDRVPRLYVTRAVHSPMLCGYVRPIIILPDIPLTANQLTGVLAHELTHYRRNDLWIKLAGMTVISLHWFNPLAYLVVSRCNREMELSCDELVLSGMDEDVRMSYGKVMLHIIQQCQIPSSDLTTHFNPRTSAVKERFVNILDATVKKRGRWITLFIAAACITAGSLVAFGSDQKTPESMDKLSSVEQSEPADKPTDQPKQESLPKEPEDLPETNDDMYSGFGDQINLFTPISYGPIDMTVLKNNELPIPVNSTQDVNQLYYYNQITPLSENTNVFAVTGRLFSERDPNFAYVLCQGSDNLWTVTALPCAPDTSCKGVILQEIPADNGIGWLLGVLMDNGGMQFFRSEDGSTWTSDNRYLHPVPENSWLVQFSKHSGSGPLCLVFDSPDWNNERIWLSFDWGITFTQYELPLPEALLPDNPEIRYLLKTSGSGNSEYSILFEVSSADESEYVCFRSDHGSTEGIVAICTEDETKLLQELIVQEYRYTSQKDCGGLIMSKSPDVSGVQSAETYHTAQYFWHVNGNPENMRSGGYSIDDVIEIPDGQIGISLTYPDTISDENFSAALIYLYSEEREEGINENGYYLPTDGSENPWLGPQTRPIMEFFSTDAGSAVYENVVHNQMGLSFRAYTVRAAERYLVRVTFSYDLEIDESITRAIISSLRFHDNSGSVNSLSPAELIPMLEAYVERQKECQKLSLWDGLPVDESAEPVEIEYGRYVPIAENSYGIHTADDLTRIKEPLLYGTNDGGLGIYEGPVYGDDGQIIGGSPFRMIDGKLYVNLDREIIYDETLEMDYSTLRDICVEGNIVTFTCRYGKSAHEKQYTLRLIEGELYW